MRRKWVLPTLLVLAATGCTNYLPVPQGGGNWEQARAGVYEQRRAAAAAAQAAEEAATTTVASAATPAAPEWPMPQTTAVAGPEAQPLPPLAVGGGQAPARDAPVFGTTAETPAWQASAPVPVASPPPPAEVAPPAATVAQPTPEPPAAEPPAVVVAVPPAPATPPTSAATETTPPPVEVAAPIDETLTPPALSGVGFLWPVPTDGGDAVATSTTGDGGLLIDTSTGEAFVASENGVVVFAADALETYGRMVVVRHDGEYTTTYAQAGEVDVEVGEIVRRGQRLGSVGGAEADPKLYFEMRVDNRVVDPRAYLVGAPKLASR